MILSKGARCIMNQALNVALCEDSMPDAKHVEYLLSECSLPTKVARFTDGSSLLSAYKPGMYDLILLDVYLGDMLGVQVAERIRAIDKDVTLVFTTNSTEYMPDGYRLNVIKYLLKPISLSGLSEALEIASLKRRKRQTLSLVIDGQRRSMPLGSIMYFEVGADVQAHTTIGAFPIGDASLLGLLEPDLPSPPFVRCHSQYIVNFAHVREIGRDFIMNDGSTVRIHPNALKQITDIYRHYLLTSMPEG